MTDTLTICARAIAECAGLNWEALPDQPDAVCGHSMPEGCKSYWIDVCRACLQAAADSVSEEMIEAEARNPLALYAGLSRDPDPAAVKRLHRRFRGLGR